MKRIEDMLKYKCMDIISICYNNISIELMLKYEERLKIFIKYLNILVKVFYRDCC